MALVAELRYRTGRYNLEKLSSEAILNLLRDVRISISSADSSFSKASLAKVLSVVEKGEYEAGENVSINLSSAKEIIDFYRENSEGGCRSCVNLGKETIDAQDATSGWYCMDYDLDYCPTNGVHYEGFSPKVKKHYKNPCEIWKPKFSPKLAELIKGEN